MKSPVWRIRHAIVVCFSLSPYVIILYCFSRLHVEGGGGGGGGCTWAVLGRLHIPVHATDQSVDPATREAPIQGRLAGILC